MKLEQTKKTVTTVYEIHKSEDVATISGTEGPETKWSHVDPFAVITFKNDEFNGCKYKLTPPYSAADWEVIAELSLIIKKLRFEHEVPELINQVEKKLAKGGKKK